jgi:hypothetical protein
MEISTSLVCRASAPTGRYDTTPAGPTARVALVAHGQVRISTAWPRRPRLVGAVATRVAQNGPLGLGSPGAMALAGAPLRHREIVCCISPFARPQFDLS